MHQTSRLRDDIALIAAADRLAQYPDDIEALMALARSWSDRDPGPAEEIFYCPLCACRKSGYIDVPNTRDEGCSDERCVCHLDRERLALLDRTDDEPLPFEQGGDAMDWADGNEQFGDEE